MSHYSRGSSFFEITSLYQYSRKPLFGEVLPMTCWVFRSTMHVLLYLVQSLSGVLRNTELSDSDTEGVFIEKKSKLHKQVF